MFNEHEMLQNSATVKQTIERNSGSDKKTSFEVELPSSSTEANTKARPENAPGRDFFLNKKKNRKVMMTSEIISW